MRSGNMTLIVLIALIQLNNFVIWADVRLNFTVKDYANPNDLDIRLKKCETFSMFGDYCDPIFQLTVYVKNPGEESQLIYKKEVGPFNNALRVPSIMNASHEQKHIPEFVEFELDIHDNDRDEDQLIAQFRRQIAFKGVGKFELPMGAELRVTVIVNLECAPNFYGNTCQTYCVPFSGHWDCNSVTGNRICSKPCVHGTCILTNVTATCLCSFGWTGETCGKPVESHLIDSMILSEDRGPQASETTVTNQNSAISVTISPTFIQNNQSKYWNESFIGKLDLSTLRFETSTNAIATANDMSKNEDNSSLHNISTNHYNESGIVAEVSVVNRKPSILYLSLLLVVVILVWSAVALAIGIICYKRRKSNRNPVYSGSMWTNTTYDAAPTISRRSCTDVHRYVNTWCQFSSDHRSTPSRYVPVSRFASRFNTFRTLPRIPALDDDTMIPPPVVTGSRIRFAATTISANPSARGYKEHVDEPYEELTKFDDEYASWEPVAAMSSKPSETHRELSN